MVERMSSVEIEDVLSSIRRLVTDDLRPKPVAVDNKLILTPALRVVPADEPATPAGTDADTLPVDLDADLAAALTADVPGEAGAQDAPPDDDVLPMFLHRDRRVDLQGADDADGAGAVDLGETVSHISAGIPADGYEAELGDVMHVPEWPESSWVAPEVIDVVEEAEVIAVPETAADMPHGDWLSEPPAQPLVDGPAMDADAAAAEVVAALEAQDAAGLTELDEDMLRDIVREIIREELQGSLGERITRNVRKLVRAEINRALMTQDLE